MDKHNMRENMLSFSQGGGDNMHGFHLILFSDSDEMHDLWLPIVPEGFFRFTDSPEHRFLSVSSKNGQWIAVCKKPAYFQNVPLEQSCEIPLMDGQLLKIDFEDRTYSLYVEKVSRNQKVYHNYPVCSDIEITIGSQPGNDIRYDNPYVSRKHAILRRSAGKWSIQDCGSIYGVFINGTKRDNANLKTGDAVCIMGLRMIIGPNFLSINDSAGRVTINQRVLQDLTPDHGGYSYYHGQELSDSTDSFFNRSPRKRLEMARKTISVEGPPMSMEQKQIPLMLRMGSSMVMGGAAALAGNFMTLISSVMFPFLSSKYTDKQRQEYEQLRFSKYREYLENKRTEIEEACREEKKFLNQKYPEIHNVINVAKRKAQLWERRPVDSDFLHIRLGTGTQLLTATIEYPTRRFELESDELEEEMYKLVESPRYVDGVPIVFSMADTRVCGLLGQRDQVVEYIRQLVLQIAIFHSYDEVKTVFFLNSEELAYLDEIRYLPHVWDDHRTIRFIATDEAEAYKLGEYIKDQISGDTEGEKELSHILKKRPYFLIFALDKKLFESHEAMKDILQSGETRGISIIAAYNDLPKESQNIITLESNQKNVCTTMSADGGEDVLFSVDSCNKKEFAEAMRVLANTRLKTAAQAQEIPKMITFLEMFKAGRIEQLNPLKRWQDNNPAKSLAAPVGVAADGSLFMLDLHEKRQGPHGLVAGMTGSGKSEFLITYILSMAVNYHPDEVAFVLIDYKGGGLAGAFENPQAGVRLPHLVGTITNLDGASIQRSLMSIESELIRRQKVFNEIKSTVNEGTMDIYAYQKLYRAGRVAEPMPHLFIISDEFAELKQQQPEFMEKLISAARIGRSLGVHLILATQKPSGVVNDQIRSNTKFRVCLRVQERSDSMDMLKRPEAAELKDTGRFYLQVGYNEYFALGQSAWCGAAYEPQDTVTVQRDDAIEFLDTAGQIIAKAKPKVKKIDSGMKQIGAVVQYLYDLAKKHGFESKQLWLEPMGNKLDVAELSDQTNEQTENGICATIGLIDDPERQSRYPLVLQLSTYRNLLLSGSSGCGKSTFLITLLYALSNRYSPEKVNYYIMDFSGGALSPFQNTPHCGAYLTEDDDLDVERLLQTLKKMAKQRKKLFAKEGVTNFEAYNQIHSIPMVFVVIDNFSGISTLKNGNAYFSAFHEYLKEAAGLGIKFLITCTNLNEISIRCKQEIDYRITLQMKDKYAYGEALNRRITILPDTCSGRGLCLHEGRALEYQTAIPFCDQNEQSRTMLLTEQAKELTERYKPYHCAWSLPTINDEETYEEFCSDVPQGRIPLGYDIQNVKKISIPLAQLYCGAVNFGNPVSIAKVLNNLIYAAQYNKMELVIVKRLCDSVFDQTLPAKSGCSEVQFLTNSAEASVQLCQQLLQEITQRKTVRNEFLTKNNIPQTEAQKPKVMKKFAPYIRQNTKPMLILFEDFYEFSSVMQDGLFKIYKEIFEGGRGYNFYFIAGFYPETKDKTAVDILSKAYISNAFVLLFGGQYENQALVSLPMAVKKGAAQRNAYNDFYMHYNNEFYPLVMPCGILESVEEDPDEQPII